MVTRKSIRFWKNEVALWIPLMTRKEIPKVGFKTGRKVLSSTRLACACISLLFKTSPHSQRADFKSVCRMYPRLLRGSVGGNEFCVRMREISLINWLSAEIYVYTCAGSL